VVLQLQQGALPVAAARGSSSGIRHSKSCEIVGAGITLHIATSTAGSAAAAAGFATPAARGRSGGCRAGGGTRGPRRRNSKRYVASLQMQTHSRDSSWHHTQIVPRLQLGVLRQAPAAVAAAAALAVEDAAAASALAAARRQQHPALQGAPSTEGLEAQVDNIVEPQIKYWI